MVMAGARDYHIDRQVSSRGEPLFRIINHNNYHISCELTDAGGLYVPFTVPANSAGAFYYVPRYEWKVFCR